MGESRFLGRKEQIKKIEQFFKSNINKTALIYGRRRVGKTELIKHCLKEAKMTSIYYECKETSEQNNVGSISEIISETFGFPPLAFSSFEEVLTFLYKQATEKNLIVVIDEYPYLRNVVKGLDSIIQSFIDNNSNSKLKIILCGSFVETMKSLLEEKSPLYGRFDLVMNLKAMDYYDSALFYEGFSNEDKVRLYSVFGGIPYYNRLVDSSKSVKQNIAFRCIRQCHTRFRRFVSRKIHQAQFHYSASAAILAFKDSSSRRYLLNISLIYASGSRFSLTILNVLTLLSFPFCISADK